MLQTLVVSDLSLSELSRKLWYHVIYPNTNLDLFSHGNYLFPAIYLINKQNLELPKNKIIGILTLEIYALEINRKYQSHIAIEIIHHHNSLSFINMENSGWNPQRVYKEKYND